MNWKNITLEEGFIRQEINVKGSKAVSYIPIEQIDSFGVMSSENKKWLYAGIAVGFFALMFLSTNQVQAGVFGAMISALLIGVYFLTRQTWFSITSSQTKFSVQVKTTKEEVMAVDLFVEKIKERIHDGQTHSFSKAA